MFRNKDRSFTSQFRQSYLSRYKPSSIPEQSRLISAMAGFFVLFAIIAMRLVDLGGVQHAKTLTTVKTTTSNAISRPDIIDRNGHLLATDVRFSSLYADPTQVNDIEDLVDKVAMTLDGVNTDNLLQRLTKKGSNFAWIKRGLVPREEEKVLTLGLAGLHFRKEPRRVYPAGAMMSHTLGFVNVDNRGQAGIERYLDSIAGVYFPKVHKSGSKPVLELSIDLGVQHILRSELQQAMKLYRAKAASGIIMDVTSGEVVAMSSLPDFNPHDQKQALNKNNLDRNTKGVFELGSIFKVITTAMALDTGVTSVNGTYDASQPIIINGFKISDYHGKGRRLSVREVFIYSSNIGSAKMAVDVGIKRHKAFLRKLGLLSPIKTELGVMQAPIVPKHWKKINTMTIAFGHGLSVTPLQYTAAISSLVNGGYYVKPTFLKRSRARGRLIAKKVIKTATSNEIRQLLRLNVVKGTGRRANAPGYRVGGKTGTAEKVINGRYDGNKLLTSFISVFPSDDPAYVVFVMLDEPHPAPGQKSRPTAGTNAAKVTASLISKVGSKLGVIPQQKSLAKAGH